jgi:hypothetical protein
MHDAAVEPSHHGSYEPACSTNRHARAAGAEFRAPRTRSGGCGLRRPDPGRDGERPLVERSHRGHRRRTLRPPLDLAPHCPDPLDRGLDVDLALRFTGPSCLGSGSQRGRGPHADVRGGRAPRRARACPTRRSAGRSSRRAWRQCLVQARTSSGYFRGRVGRSFDPVQRRPESPSVGA